MTETDLIGAEIDFRGYDTSVENIVLRILEEFRRGESRYSIQDMIDADQYFRVKNVAIQEKNRDLAGQANTTMSNAKIPSGFLRMNVQQKVNYALGKPPILGVIAPNDNENDPLKEQYLAEWTSFLNDDRMKTITRISTDAISKGIGWNYVVIIDGQLEIEDFEPQQMYPQWHDRAHTDLDVIIRDYKVIVYVDRQKKVINKVEFWDNEMVRRFTYDGGALSPDTDQPAIDSHMTLTTNVAGEPQPDQKIGWGKVPFIALKGTVDELPMLNIIRDNIDNYDKLHSKSVDALLDDIDPVLILEGFTPNAEILLEQRRMMQNSRIAAAPASSTARAGAYFIQVKPDITAVQQKLEHISKDIRKFGQAVMSQESDSDRNPSSVSLKFRYQDMDTYINGFETEMREYLCKQLKYFFDIWLEFKGVGKADIWKNYQLTFKFDRDMMINTSADIEDTVKLMATGISQETIDNYNPAVISHEIEQSRREAEQNSGLADMAAERSAAQDQTGGDE